MLFLSRPCFSCSYSCTLDLDISKLKLVPKVVCVESSVDVQQVLSGQLFESEVLFQVLQDHLVSLLPFGILLPLLHVGLESLEGPVSVRIASFQQQDSQCRNGIIDGLCFVAAAISIV